MVRVLLLRHAQSTWNAGGRWQGWADPPLSSQGEAEAEAAAADPVLDVVSAVVASDLQRAQQTATLLGRGRDWPPVGHLRGLRERGAGEWTGLTRPAITQRWPGALDRPFADIPGGEPVPAVTARAVVALHRLADEHPDAAILAVSHGALIRALEHHLGVPVLSVPNLAGRWIEVDGGQLRAGAAAGPLGRPGLERAG